MLRNALLSGSRPRVPFEVYRSLRLPREYAYRHMEDRDYGLPPSIISEATNALRAEWLEVQAADKMLWRKRHPQLTSATISLIHRQEIVTEQKPAAYRKLLRQLWAAHTETDNLQFENEGVIPRVGALCLGEVTIQPLAKGHMMLLQPSDSSDPGIAFLQRQRAAGQRMLGELASPLAFEAGPVTADGIPTAPLDIGVPIAHFPSYIEPDTCVLLGKHVQERLNERMACNDPPLSALRIGEVGIRY